MENRGSFASKLGVVLATAGSAVGLGNIWRFPYLTGENGGAAFILVYLVCVFILGIPGMVAEFIVGRHSASNAARAYRSLSKGEGWGAIGYVGMVTSMLILGFYAVVAGWCMQYLFASIMGELKGDAQFVANYFQEFSSDLVRPMLWGVGFVLLTHFVVVKGVRNGIERFSKILMPMLFVLLLILVIASCSLPGAMAGVEFNDVDLGYFDVDEPQVPHIMTVPEQSSNRLMGDVAMPSGFAYGIGRALGGEWSVYRLENQAVAGSMGFQMEGVGQARSVKEGFQAAFSQFWDNFSSVAPGMRAGEKDAGPQEEGRP